MSPRGRKPRGRSRTPRRSGGTAVLSFTPAELDQDIQSGRLRRAADRLIEGLTLLAAGGGPESDDPAFLAEFDAWWARQYARIVGNPAFRPDARQFAKLLVHKRTAMDLFGCTHPGHADALLRVVSGQIAENAERGGVDAASLQRAMLANGLESRAGLAFEDFLDALPETSWPAWFSLLSTKTVLSPRASERRSELQRLADRLGESDPTWAQLPLMAQAWFLCSYEHHPDKHRIKRHLNDAIRTVLSDNGIRDLDMTSARPERARPVLLVPLEAFASTHAMYRCFAPTLALLGRDFDLVGVFEPSAVDATSRALFGRTIEVGPGAKGLRSAVRAIERLAPDMAYFPSVGMSTTGIALANLRLAPIQIATPGHPATTHCPTMDYMAVQEVYTGAAPCFSETVVLFQRGSIQHAKRTDGEAPAPRIRRHDGPVRVSVSSAVFKLNPEFMAVCRAIDEAAHRPVEFHFFPNLNGLALRHAARRIRDWLPGAHVHPTSDYATYLKALSMCEIQLAPFPFGGTNSTLDALHQAIPSVAMERGEVHNRTDAVLLREAGLPEWLICPDEDAYTDAAVRLIDDAEELFRIRSSLEATDLDAIFHDTGFSSSPSDMAALFGWVHRNHAAIQAAGKDVWHRADRGRVVPAPDADAQDPVAESPGSGPGLAGRESPALAGASSAS
ncbi:MAG: hypothetical protein RH859_04635 [Longimicrobiales bacterium]